MDNLRKSITLNKEKNKQYQETASADSSANSENEDEFDPMKMYTPVSSLILDFQRERKNNNNVQMLNTIIESNNDNTGQSFIRSQMSMMNLNESPYVK
jgi:hypothetical protein